MELNKLIHTTIEIHSYNESWRWSKCQGQFSIGILYDGFERISLKSIQSNEDLIDAVHWYTENKVK